MYRKSPQWTLLLEDERAVVSAGADELYLLDELDAAQSRRLVDAWRKDAFDGDGAGIADLAPMLAKLERLGALLRTPRAASAEVRFRLRGLGAAHQQLAELVALLAAGAGGLSLVSDGPTDLLIWFRAGETLLGALGDYAAVDTPHLFVDLAYHHTVSLGPLVWPRETACLGCLGGRIRHAWGDPEPPPEPGAARHLALIAALVVEQLVEFRAHGSCPRLVERTVAIDLQTLTTKSERVHRLPWCPWCFPSEAPRYGTGSFALPWMVNR